MSNLRYEKEIISTLSKAAKQYGPPDVDYYRSKLNFVGHLPVPIQREISKKGFSFSGLPEEKLKRIWSDLFISSDYFHVKSQALLFFERWKGSLGKEDWDLLKLWGDSVENWAHSDSLSDYHAELYEKYPSLLLPTYKRWNVSKKPWLRRLSLVGLFYYARSRTVMPSKSIVFSFLTKRLYDDAFYVQRGVGWTLREALQVYPKETWNFLVKNVAELSPHAWQAATEKLSRAQKKSLIEKRSKRR